MAGDEPKATADGVNEADLATAFQELAKGERTATALENQLSAMEAKIEALLAQAEKDQQEVQRRKEGSANAGSSTNGESGADSTKQD